jgi:hypothetical protein
MKLITPQSPCQWGEGTVAATGQYGLITLKTLSLEEDLKGHKNKSPNGPQIWTNQDTENTKCPGTSRPTPMGIYENPDQCGTCRSGPTQMSQDSRPSEIRTPSDPHSGPPSGPTCGTPIRSLIRTKPISGDPVTDPPHTWTWYPLGSSQWTKTLMSPTPTWW